MHRFLRGFFSFVFFVLIVSVVVALLMNFSSGLDEFEIPYNKVETNSKRVAQTGFSVPLSHVAGNNYFWYKAAQASVDSDIEFNDSFTNIDSTFYRNNDLDYASFEVAFSGLLDSDMALNEAKLNQTIKYFSGLKLGDERSIQFSDVQFLGPFMGTVLQRLNVNYASVESRVERALLSQFTIAGKVFSLNKGKAYRNIVIEMGYIPTYDLKVRSFFGARSTSIYRVARNVITAWRDYEKQNGESNFRILIKNSYSSDIGQNQKLAQKNERYILGEDLYELRELRRDMIRYNSILGSPIKNIRDRIGYAVDMNNLVGVWQSPSVALYKNDDKSPLDLGVFIDAVLKDRRGLLKYNFRGDIDENPIHIIYASYNRATENRVGESNEQNLPYTRTTEAQSVRVLNQLKIMAEIFEVSPMGNIEADSFVVLDIPRRQLFPIYHNTIKPFYGLMAAMQVSQYLFANSAPEKALKIFYYPPPGAETWSEKKKPNLADRWEQEYSLRLVKNYLKAKVK